MIRPNNQFRNFIIRGWEVNPTVFSSVVFLGIISSSVSSPPFQGIPQ